MRHPARHSSTTILWRFASAIRTFSKNYPRDLAPQSARLHRTPSISAAPSDQIPQNYGSWVKGDLAIRPIFHHEERRIEAHIFIAFLAYCSYITLQRRLHALAPGLSARSAIEKFAAVQMIDVHVPTTDGRELVLTRYTQPEPELQLLINQLKLQLPPQPPPKITTADQPRQPLS